jgi:23S rRNA (uracil1939-C5)-methyltransferase
MQATRAHSRLPMRVRLRIDGIAAGGAGVGRGPNGRVVFVHRTAPGELIDTRVLQQKPRWARGELLRVLEPAAERREAPCRFYDRCGGCTLEHIGYEAQLRAKSQIVMDALHRIGGLSVEPPQVVPSPAEFRYRNRVSFTLLRFAGGRVVAGFHELHRPDRVVDIDASCLLPEQPVAAAWAALRGAWGRNAHRLPAGPKLRLTVRAAASGQSSLLVQGGYGPGRPDELCARVPALAAIWQQPRPGAAAVLLAGSAQLEETWSDEDVALSGGVFLQVNRGSAALLEEHVLACAGDVSGRIVVDAYCGVGLHARRLVRLGARVTGIELDPLAAAEAQRAAPDVRFISAPVEEALAGTLPADLVVLNPPRAGVAQKALDVLLARPPDRIIYVSCDPATLARDVRRLTPRFHLNSMRCFDLFPQTAHVETVVVLTCSTT